MNQHGTRSAVAPGWRDAFVDASVVLGLAVVAVTEVLSRLSAVTTAGAVIAWSIVAIAIALWFLRKGARPAVITRARIPEMTREERLCVAFMAMISLVTLYVGLAGAPNAADSLSYHLPRILRWIQDRSVEFYPTHNVRQLWIGPAWEYFALQLQLFAGTDRLSSLVQWFGFVASPAVVSLIAREIGASRRGQLLAALFTLTIPMAIAESTGSQVDVFSGFWLAVSLALIFRIRRQSLAGTGIGTALLFGSAVGIAVFSKATNALFLIPFTVWVALAVVRKAHTARFVLLATSAAAMALAVNAGHMYRNHAIFGSVLGYKDARRVANQTFGPKALASNIIRNSVLHLNTPSDRVNEKMTRGIGRLHAAVGLDVNDRRTTYERVVFAVPPEWDGEGQGSNQFHFLLIIFVGIWLTLRKPGTVASRYLWCVFGAALLFCIYLKWQPWHSRLHLPLFMIAGAGVGAALEDLMARQKQTWVAIALAFIALHPTFRDSLRPLATRRPIFTMSYEQILLNEEHRLRIYAGAADVIASSGCAKIGLVGHYTASEFAIWKLVERRIGAMPEIRHLYVTNESRAAESDHDRAFRPCAIVFIEPSRPELAPLQIFTPQGFARAWRDEHVTIFLPTLS